MVKICGHKLNDVESDINDYMSKITTLMNDSIKAFVSEEPQNFVSKILELGDNKIKLGDMGDGVQYAFNIILSILDSILELKKNKSDEKFEECLVYSDEKKYFPIVLLLDEPEIHQHPQRQRLIMKRIVCLKNSPI